MLESVIDLLTTYQYVFLFFGLLAFGESIFFGAAYLVYIGEMDFFLVMTTALSATLLADFIWYEVGRQMPHNKLIKTKIYKKNIIFFDKVLNLFDQWGLRIIFISKFIYGIRIVSQIVAGMRKLPFFAYLVVNTLGLTIVYLMIFILIVGTGDSAEALNLGQHKLPIILSIVALVVILAHVWARRFLKKI